MTEWVLRAGDNASLPFVIIDKRDAVVLVYDGTGGLLGVTPALLGLAPGDDITPGIGDRPLSKIKPEERITPAGRFVASMGRNIKGSNILWVDYDAAVSLHAVVPGTPQEKRRERLTSDTPLDNRISFGCINVPATFFQKVVSPTFSGAGGIVYILPEHRPLASVFAMGQPAP
ncbi:hypothetical protein [Iodidimonas sp. SYSU 1G8]|uniref:hypothetical protein n=1 Tax=Iodidimonas sp. SYSU 1G8 TaxID=3133967 RepID=UPI0031FEA7FF